MNETSRNAKVVVSGEVDALYIQLAEEIAEYQVANSESVELQSRASQVIFDFSDDGHLLGIEIIGIEGLLSVRPRANQ